MMKNLKTIILTAYIALCCLTNGFAQKSKSGHVTLIRKNGAMIYLGGGISNPSSTTKEAGMVNGIDLNLSVYKPIWVWENTTLGINAGGGYSMGNSDFALDNRYTVYQLQGQSAPPTVSEKGTGSPKAAGFKFEAGPQMNVHLGDVTLSPIFNVGYMSMEQKAFAVTETVQLNTVNYPFDLLTQKATKTNGLGIIPKVRLSYNITPNIGIWVEGSYTMGPKKATESTRFVLDPTISSDQYNLGHFQDGQYITTKTDTKYSAMGLSGGIVISLGGSSASKLIADNNEVSDIVNQEQRRPHGRHTCLICGRKHRGTCRRGMADSDTEISALRQAFNANAGKLYDGENDNCDAKKGVACTDEVSLSASYDLKALKSIVSTNDPKKIKDFIAISQLKKALGDNANAPIWLKIFNAIENGKITLKSFSDNPSHYVLRIVDTEVNGYVGHVTLLR